MAEFDALSQIMAIRERLGGIDAQLGGLHRSDEGQREDIRELSLKLDRLTIQIQGIGADLERRLMERLADSDHRREDEAKGLENKLNRVMLIGVGLAAGGSVAVERVLTFWGG